MLIAIAFARGIAIVPAPSQASVVASGGIVFWSDGVTKFDGFAVFVLALPSGYTTATVANQYPPQQIAQRFRCGIVNGVPDSAVRINYNSSLNPPGTKYEVVWYDGEDQQIYLPGSAGELFTVTASPVTLPAVSLTKPPAASTLPTFP